MPFHADRYYANKFRKEAWERLAQARDIRARQKSGETVYDWEIERISNLVKLARISMHLYLGQLSIIALKPPRAKRRPLNRRSETPS